MSESSTLKAVKIKHVYDCYPLYKELYGSTPQDKFSEALTSAAFIDTWVHTRRPDLLKSGLSLIEIQSGLSEHEKYFREYLQSKLNNYYNNDIVEHPQSVERGIIVGDCTTIDYPKVDLVIAQYYAVSQFFDEDGLSTRKRNLEAFTHIRKQLPTGGAFLIDMFTDGYRTGLEDFTLDRGKAEKSFVKYGSPLIEYCRSINPGFKLNKDTFISYSSSFEYDRFTSNVHEFLHKVVVTNGNYSVLIEVETAFTQRYWSEPEIVDIAMEAGFTDAMFFLEEDIDGDHYELPAYFEADRKGNPYCEEIEDLMPNKILFIV